jgi:hypothetical protein
MYYFEERNASFLIHAHTWSHLLCYARQSCKMLKFVEHFSRQSEEVISASSKRTSDKRFEILRQFATMFR